MSIRITRRSLLRSSVALCAPSILSYPLGANAQDAYPSRPVRIVVHYPPGGSSDILARALAQRLSASFGQPVVVENRVGGNGHIGLEHAARSAPDGYTLVLVGAPITISPAIYKTLPFDSIRDFAPISMLARTPLVLVAAKDFPAANAAEFLAMAKAKPPKTFSYAYGSPAFLLAAEIMSAQAGIQLLSVPYRGVNEGRTDLIAGRVSVMAESVGPVLPLIRGGQVKALAQLGPTRIAQLPNVPTLAEQGLAGYEVETWAGLMAPAGTPPAIISRVNAEVMRVMDDPEVKAKFVDMGLYTEGSTPAALGEVIRKDIAKFKAAVRQAKIELQ